jgi:membrane protease YdiL (CAAX protease family)
VPDLPAERVDPDAPGDERPIRWGLGDVVIGFIAGQVLSAIAYVFVVSVTDFSVGGTSGPGEAFGQVAGHVANGNVGVYRAPMPLWLQAIVQIPLWACLLGVPIVATLTKGNGPRRDLGLRIRPIDVPVGVAIGVAAQFVLVPLIYWPILKLIGNQDVSGVARQLTDRATDPFGIVMLMLIVGIGAPIAEEVFFRGLTQRSLDRRWGRGVALFGTAALFAFTHFEALQFPALFAFGLLLGAMVFATGRLGTSICAHLGFNLVAAASLVWGLEPPLWALGVIAVLGLVAVGYLVASTRPSIGSDPEKPTLMTAP